MRIGLEVRGMRDKAGISQRALAEAADVSLATITLLERSESESRLKPKTLRKIMAVFGYEVVVGLRKNSRTRYVEL